MKKAHWMTIAAAALAVTGCATPAERSTAPSLSRVEMETRSFWYALSAAGTDFISHWQLDSDGRGRFRSVEWRRVGDVFERSDVVRGISVGRRGFRRIQSLLSAAEQSVRDDRIQCGEVPYTDSAHGYVAWTRGGSTRRAEFNQGCPTKEARRIYARMDEAEEIMSGWAKNGVIISSERLPDKP